jgi:hypothetical protein
MRVEPRLILLHKQATSGRLRFLCLPSGVLLFGALPQSALLRDEEYSPQILIHPTALVREAEVLLALPDGAIVAEAGFSAWVDSVDGDVPVLLAAFASIDPPFAAVERSQGRFIAITESRHLSEVERALLRRVYEYVLG